MCVSKKSDHRMLNLSYYHAPYLSTFPERQGQRMRKNRTVPNKMKGFYNNEAVEYIIILLVMFYVVFPPLLPEV